MRSSPFRKTCSWSSPLAIRTPRCGTPRRCTTCRRRWACPIRSPRRGSTNCPSSTRCGSGRRTPCRPRSVRRIRRRRERTTVVTPTDSPRGSSRGGPEDPSYPSRITVGPAGRRDGVRPSTRSKARGRDALARPQEHRGLVTTDRITRDDTASFPEFDGLTAHPDHPMTLARRWLDAATAREVREPLAMTLATASLTGVLSARTVDVKEFADEGLLFGTGTDTPTGVELTANPNAALHAYWRETGQQLRFEGHVVRLDDAAADALFAARSPKSRAATAASHQSAAFPAEHDPRSVVDDLIAQANALLDEHGDDVPRPPAWAAYRLVPDVAEFWLSARDRVYRRLRYRSAEGSWRVDRLQP
ncbi:hypothetical protein DEI81_06730 [Curtobacterium sp. MCBD17_013]|nr:hypothetical protein DEI81_06730 [Curtobacterium sp. MCBD17_013]